MTSKYIPFILIILLNGFTVPAGRIETAAADIQSGSQQDNYTAGKSYFGRNKYIEYMPGNLPVVISVPHGGYETPDEIKDRVRGTDHHDKKTIEAVLEIKKHFYELTGKYPYIIINRLHRIKLDPNRDYDMAVQNDSLAGIAYTEFQNFIELAEKDVEEKWGRGFYIDLHGHNHTSQLIELGYLLESEILSFNDADLSDDLFVEKSSVRNLMKKSEFSFPEVIRGEVSFGGILEKYGYGIVPGPSIKAPDTEFFFSGGYNTLVHGPTETNHFNSMQIELPTKGVRDSDENIVKVSRAITESILEFMRIHYKLDLTKPGSSN